MSKDINTAPLDEYWEPRVGQKVVCLKTSSPSENGDRFIKGKTYEVDWVTKCHCGKILISVTTHITSVIMKTNLCHISMPIYFGKPLGNTKYFAPLQSYPDATAEIMEKYPLTERIETDIEVVVNN